MPYLNWPLLNKRASLLQPFLCCSGLGSTGLADKSMARVLPYMVGLCLAMVIFVLASVTRLFATRQKFSEDLISLVVTKVNTSPYLRMLTTQKDNNNLSVPASSYVVDTIGCKIPRLDPFDDSIKEFIKEWPVFDCGVTNAPSITYQDGDWLRINRTALQYYRGSLAFCQLSAVIRQNGTDDEFMLIPVMVFSSDIQVKSEFVKVECFNTAGNKLGINFHMFIQRKTRILDELESRGQRFRKKYGVKKPLSVIVVVTDSMSRLNMIRQLPKTRDYLLSSLGAIEFLGYNKVGDNTFPNVIPMVTGKFVSELGLNSSTLKSKYMDKFNYIWKQYSLAGYATFMAEDDPTYTEFNYLKLGFADPPTDYYYRPMSLAMEQEKSLWRHAHSCIGDRFEIQFLLDWLRDFLRTANGAPTFSFTFLTRLSHNYLNKVKVGDGVYLKFLKTLKAEGHLNNSILFFSSDHGMRFGDFRQTYVGSMEDRLPMLFAVLPKWFRRAYPTQFSHLQTNSARLTNAFDVYQTFKDILFLNSTTRPSPDKRARGVSLFSSVSLHRTCADAGISVHWCTCTSRVQLSTTNQYVQRAAMAIVVHINSIVGKTRTCAQLSLLSVHQAWRHYLTGDAFRDSHPFNDTHLSTTDYQVTLTTTPGLAKYEATVRHDGPGDKFEVLGDISRISVYRTKSFCIRDHQLKKYCFCEKHRL